MKGAQLTSLSIWILCTTNVLGVGQLCENRQYVEVGKVSTLRCSIEKDFDGVYWYATNESTTEKPFIKLEDLTKSGEGYITGDYDLASDGSLIINHASYQHEHVYRIVVRYLDPFRVMSDDVNVYVIVIPDPPEIIVEGCQHPDYCLLPPESTGNVFCSIKGIRPAVELEWVQGNETSLDAISLSDQHTTVSRKDYTYDISLTAQFHVTGSVVQFTLQCKVTGEYDTIFNLQKTVDIITVEERGEMPAENRKFWLLSVFVLIVPAIFVLLWVSRRGNRKCGADDKTMSTLEENEPMNEPNSTEIKLTGSIKCGTDDNGMSTLEEVEIISNSFEEDFLDLRSQIKCKYRGWNDEIKPYNESYNLNDIFVEGPLQMSSHIEGNITKEWKTVSSYHDIFKPEFKRVILEADPGYGKTTLCLRVIDEWCQENPLNSLNHIDLLIYLRLKEVREDISIHEAIKKLLLPVGSCISEDAIRAIFKSQGKKIVLLLDGYDELCINQQFFKVDDIVSGSRLQNVNVILLTRTSILPSNIFSSTKRFILNGFDASTRAKYIANIQRIATSKGLPHFVTLQQYPVLKELCEVPLLFTFFVDFLHESKDSGSEKHFAFRTVTSLMEEGVKCFYLHMKNKGSRSADENTYERESKDLEQLAYESMFEKESEYPWQVTQLTRKFGEDHYRFLLRLGILVKRKRRHEPTVKFLKDIFCEWYAAHHVATIAKQPNFTLTTQPKTDHIDIKYIYQFACGMNQGAAAIITRQLLSKDDGTTLAILCRFEKDGDVEKMQHFVTELCQSPILFVKNNSKLFQQAKISLLEMASTNLIPIKGIILDKIYEHQTSFDGHLGLNSGLSIQHIRNMEEIYVIEHGRVFTSGEIDSILQFATGCCDLQELRFIDCFLPSCIPSFSNLRTNADVRWEPLSKEKIEFGLDVKSGMWLNADQSPLEWSEYEDLEKRFEIHYREDSCFADYSA